MSKESIKYEMADKRNWSEEDRLRDDNKRIKIELEILDDKYQSLVSGINRDNTTIDRLSKTHYHIAKENERELRRIYEEIVSINIFLKNLRTNNEN